MAARKPSPIIIARAEWTEATVVCEPIKNRHLKEPTLLVRRNVQETRGQNGERVFTVEGAGQHISLFTGAGGMDLGCEQAGFVTVVQHEWEEAACDTLIANRPNYFRHSALIQGDIRETPTSMILGAANLRTGEADLLTGGPPCQGFSNAGKRDPSDIRNTLIFDFLRVVRESQPRFFVMENVPGFVSMKKNGFLRQFLETAYDAYYELVYGLADACCYGVPQHRTRFLCMGTRRDLWEIEGKLGSLPQPMYFDPQDLKELSWLDKRPLFSREAGLLRHAPGVRYFPDRKLLIPPEPTYGGRVSKKFQAFYERLYRDEPDRIVTDPQGREAVDESFADQLLAGIG